MADTPQITPATIFPRLLTAMQGKPEAQARVNAHILAKYGHPHLMAFHNNGSTDEEKLTCYATLLKAVKEGRYDGLMGDVPNGQAKAEEPGPAAPEPPKTIPVPEPAPVAPPVAGNPAELMALALQQMIHKAGAAGTQPVDLTTVRAIVSEQMTTLRAGLEKKVADYLAQVPPRERIEVVNGGGVNAVEGVFHWQLPQIITWVAADVPLWLWGRAGGGKTHLGRQVAEALKMPATIVSIDPTITVGKLLGYRNLANGEFVEGFLFRPYRDGGLVMLDEIDTGDPGILAALNALLANSSYLFPNGETIPRHPQLRIIAGANTKGVGAVAGYTARNRLDAATLDRFAVIELEYDTDLEMSLAVGCPKPVTTKRWGVRKPCGEDAPRKWVEYIQKVREKVSGSVLVSPRASILGVRALRAGVPVAEVEDALLFKLMASDTRTNIINECGRLQL